MIDFASSFEVRILLEVRPPLPAPGAAAGERGPGEHADLEGTRGRRESRLKCCGVQPSS